MRINEIIRVEDVNESYRIDKYLYDEFEDLSRSRIQQLIADGNILLNSKKTKKNVKVINGDIISLTVPSVEETDIEPQEIDIDILYEDDFLAVVNKPRGMVVHPAPSHRDNTLVNALMYHLKNLSSIGGYKRPGIVHRIDKDTSGLLMIAKNDLAHKSLSNQLRERTVGRLYRAIVHGGFSEETGCVDIPISRDKKNRLKMSVDIEGRPAKTNYKLLEKLGNYSLIELKLESGRTHQIRVHMKHIKHPLLGDPLYGARSDKYLQMGQLLHAKTLEFDHPYTNERLRFDSELPTEFLKVLEEIRKKA